MPGKPQLIKKKSEVANSDIQDDAAKEELTKLILG